MFHSHPTSPSLFRLKRRASACRAICAVLGATTLFLAASATMVHAASVAVLNPSFESPVPPPGFPAFPVIDSWQKTPEIPGIPLPGGITWDQLSGVFPNTAPGMSDHIDNMTGNQAAYMFSIPGVGIFQDLTTSYVVGSAYSLTLGVIGGGGGMTEGSSLLVGMYYRDGANNMVPVGSLPVTFTAAGFPTTTHFLDFTLNLPAVPAGAPWAGHAIGLEFLSSSGTGAGYWDLDNVRLEVVPEPSLVALATLGGAGLMGWRWIRRRKV